MPGLGTGKWKGTKNNHDHKIWIGHVLPLIDLHLEDERSPTAKAKATSKLMQKLIVLHKRERATPHDLRRTFCTTVTKMGFDRDAMN